MSDRRTDSSTLALIKGRPVRYRVRRSRRARKVGVQVCRRDGVVVVLPWKYPFHNELALDLQHDDRVNLVECFVR